MLLPNFLCLSEQIVKKMLIVRKSQKIFIKTIDKWEKQVIIIIVSTQSVRVLKTKRGDKNRVNSKKEAGFKSHCKGIFGNRRADWF